MYATLTCIKVEPDAEMQNWLTLYNTVAKNSSGIKRLWGCRSRNFWPWRLPPPHLMESAPALTVEPLITRLQDGYEWVHMTHAKTIQNKKGGAIVGDWSLERHVTKQN